MVYRARDVRLRRDVAVKLLRRELVSSEGFVERFEREAQALAALRHANIVPIYSIGEQDELIFLVMPFVSGNTLTEYLREHGRLSLDEAARHPPRRRRRARRRARRGARPPRHQARQHHARGAEAALRC